MKERRGVLLFLVFILVGVSSVLAALQIRIPQWTENLLIKAKVSGNMESYHKGLRGAANHMIYDMQDRKSVM